MSAEFGAPPVQNAGTSRPPMILNPNTAHLIAKRWAATSAVLLALAASNGSAIAQAKLSFDCSKAASVAEKAICAAHADGTFFLTEKK
ncbi:hypothetical protein NKI20_20750 [Mesorhizobium sp. M0830]|uniref:hypothetical protein n=1 Tax=Mesorhizobium sp. M0830 TaxID=2957008 RepID=UPI00333946BE